jgi:hypothetical protein
MQRQCNNKRTTNLVVRLNRGERAALRFLAARRGVSISTITREVLVEAARIELSREGAVRRP